MSIVTYQRGDTTALSKNFTRDEFECQCGKCTAQMIDTELVDKLQHIRDVLGVPLKITSGYRCIVHNASKTVGGSPNSKHRYGMAADWRTLNRTVNPVALGIIAQAVGFGGIGIYWHPKAAMCHADTRTGKATCSAPRRESTPAPPTRSSFCRPSAGAAPGGKPGGHEDAPAAAGADPGRHFRREHRERSAESAGGARTGRGRHLRSGKLESHFRRGQVSQKTVR